MYMSPQFGGLGGGGPLTWSPQVGLGGGRSCTWSPQVGLLVGDGGHVHESSVWRTGRWWALYMESTGWALYR
jgi:hypothetical protein